MDLVYYHNPRCTKSRQGLQLLESKGLQPTIVKYLDNPPSQKELRTIIKKLGIKPADLVRKTESIYKEKFKGKQLSDEEWIEAMIQYPKLIQRPILIKGDKAVVGRPTEALLDIL